MIHALDRAVIDEIQRAPQLLLAIKQSVDEDRRPGRFLLTGSANLMTLPTVADSLAGRMEILTLFPLPQAEIASRKENWIDHAFAGRILAASQPVLGGDLVERVLQGGYPEALSRHSAKRRKAWARQYLDAIVQRDVRDVAQVDKLDTVSRFLRALAQKAGQMCNYTQLGGQMGLDGKTAARYVGIFERMYLLRRVDVWARNTLTRIVKTPKLQFIDSGLLSTLLDLERGEVLKNKKRFGHVLETFVYAELLKQTTTAEGDYRLLYYKDADAYEVDIIVENSAGKILCIEVKASSTVTKHDLRGLQKLATIAGEQFSLSVLLYDGTEILPLGQGIWAVPLSSLWGL